MAVKRKAAGSGSRKRVAKLRAGGAAARVVTKEPSAREANFIAQDAFQPNAQARALLMGVKRKEADLRSGGGAFPLDDVLTLLGISRQAVHKKVQEGALFAVKGPAGRLLFPTLQFTSDGPVAGLKRVIAAFPSTNRWLLLNFLVNPTSLLNKRAPIDVLKHGDIDAVVQAARQAGGHERGALDGQTLRQLYARAFAEFGSAALWNKKAIANPTPGDALAIARALRIEGNLKARRLAEDIEALANAAH